MTPVLFIAVALMQAPNEAAPATSPAPVILNLAAVSTTGLRREEEQALRARIEAVLTRYGVGVRWRQAGRAATKTTEDETLVRIEVVRLGSVVTWSVSMPDLETRTPTTRNWTDSIASLESLENLTAALLSLAEVLRHDAQPRAADGAHDATASLNAAPADPAPPLAVGQTPADLAPRRSGVGVAPVVAWSLGVVGLAVAAVFAIKAYNFHDEYGSDSVPASTRSAWLRAQQLEAAGLGAGGAAAIAGTAMWYFDWP